MLLWMTFKLKCIAAYRFDCPLGHDTIPSILSVKKSFWFVFAVTKSPPSTAIIDCPRSQNFTFVLERVL